MIAREADERARAQAQTLRTRQQPSPRVSRWRSLRNHRAAPCSRRCLRSRLALATLHLVPAC